LPPCDFLIIHERGLEVNGKIVYNCESEV